jgi:hypothetical protein
MKFKYGYFLIFLIIALVAAFLVWKYTFRKSETSMVDQKPEFELKASVLIQAFETDETAANQKYLGKVILVSGHIDSITVDSLTIAVNLKESDAAAGVICSFDKNNLNVARLQKGTYVNIKGICTGYLMDVVMNRCFWVEGNND